VPNFRRAAMEIQLHPAQGDGFTMFRIVLVAAATLALAGCASSESETLFRADDAKCKRYEHGSDAYVQCRLAIDIQRANTEAAAATAPRR